jgi:ACS family hexuronate transporter-like MFS transporter
VLRSLTGPFSQFYWLWLPEYLSSARGLSLEQLGRVVWIPYPFGGLGNVFGGFLAGRLQKLGSSVDLSRRLPLFTDAIIASSANLVVYIAPSVPLAVTVLA